MSVAIICIRIGLLVLAVLGAVHLKYTFADLKHPRYFTAEDKTLLPLMQNTRVRIIGARKNKHSFWRGYMGFHVSHSAGILAFTAIYLSLSFIDPVIIFHPLMSVLLVGGGVGYAVMARCFWFSIPIWGTGIAAIFLIFGVLAHSFQF